MKIVSLLLVCFFIVNSVHAQKEVYKSVKTLNWGQAVNEPFFVEGREISRLLIDGVLKEELTPHDFSSLKKLNEINKQSFLKILHKIGDEYRSDTFDPVLYQIQIVEKVVVNQGELVRVKPQFIDLRFNTEYLFGSDIDDKIARFKYKDCKKIFKKDDRALWINPYNNAHQIDFHRALADNLYIPDKLKIYHDEKGVVFSGNNKGKRKWILGEMSGLKPLSDLLNNRDRIRNPGFDKDFYRWYIIEMLVDLKKSLNLERTQRIELLNAIFTAGKEGQVSFFLPESQFWDQKKVLSPENFVKRFQYKIHKDSNEKRDEDKTNQEYSDYEYVCPVDSIYQLMLVGELKIDSSGIKSYQPKYLGLIIASDQNPTGLYKSTAYTDIVNLESILTRIVVGDKTYMDLMKSPESDATRYIHLTNVFGGSYSITYDSFTDKIWSSQIPEYVDLELFRNEIYTGK